MSSAYFLFNKDRISTIVMTHAVTAGLPLNPISIRVYSNYFIYTPHDTCADIVLKHCNSRNIVVKNFLSV